MSILLAAGVGFAAFYKYKKKRKERRRSELNNDHHGQESGHTLMTHVQNVSESEQLQLTNQIDDLKVRVDKRIILADLIRGMYDRVNNKPDYSQRWKNHHYELVTLQDILTTDELCACQHYIKKEEEYKYFGVFRKKETTLASPAAPEWVVAIRGTNKGSRKDIVNDIKICLERLHTSSTVKLLEIVISRMVKKYNVGFDPQGWLAVTGHSLGASKAMLVARQFALQGCLLDSHFFNPPFVTLTAMARTWMRNLFSPIYGDKFRRIEMGIIFAFNLILDGGKRMQKQRLEYRALTKWSPYLYLNKKDPICKLYISHFTRSRTKAQLHENIYTWYSPGSALLRATLGDAETFHLMPRAICCIAQTNQSSWAAHRLENWTSTQHDVRIIVKVFNLVVEVNEERKQLTLNVVAEGIEGDLGEEGEEASAANEEEECLQEGDSLEEEDDLDQCNWSTSGVDGDVSSCGRTGDRTGNREQTTQQCDVAGSVSSGYSAGAKAHSGGRAIAEIRISEGFLYGFSFGALVVSVVVICIALAIIKFTL